MKNTAIIQARMSSTRLPGKVLRMIGSKSMLAWTVTRTQQARSVDEVVVATTTDPEDEQVVKECKRLGVPVYRGSKLDVLDRYFRTALMVKAETVVRITSDCPFIDPEVVDELCGKFHSGIYDYGSNRLKHRYPRGLDTEVISFESLERAWLDADRDYQRVHVTPYFYDNPEIFSILSVVCPEDYSKHRWTVDTYDDLLFVRNVMEKLGFNLNVSWRDILAQVEKEPSLAEINSHICQKNTKDC